MYSLPAISRLRLFPPFPKLITDSHKNFNAGDADWLAYSWVYYNKVIYGKFKFPTL